MVSSGLWSAYVVEKMTQDVVILQIMHACS